MTATAAMANFAIDDFDFLGESTLGVATGFLFGAGFCGSIGCGVVA